ncbi:transposase family protein [Spirosoma spitsbergense]|uniref:transposase family protein n=1 Tax=Spirosoma spitsbergense TaxID=431554 RepID=UPI001B7FDCF7
MSQPIKEYFQQIKDFRQAKKCRHRLSDILLIGICTYLSNGQDYEDMRGRPVRFYLLNPKAHN